MGIDTSSRMIVGEEGSKITIPDDADSLGDWADDNGMETMSPYYDSDSDEWTVGFAVKDVPVNKMDEEWFADIKNKADKFESLTGTKARLIGALNVF